MPQAAEEIKISIVVPCYNTLEYLPRCIDSLLAQTLDGIEIILVNDESPDDSLALLREYEAKYPGLVRVVDKKNGGLWSARWSGTDVARGEYMAYLDSDDYVEPTFAEDFYTTLTTEHADVAICGLKRIDEPTGKVLSVEMNEKLPSFTTTEDAGRTIGINSAAWNKCYRRDLLMQIERIADPPLILEDVALTQLVYLNIKGRIAFTGTAPYNYMLHEGSMINTVTVPQIDSVKTALTEIKEQFDAKPASQELQQAIAATVFLHLGISMTYRLACTPGVDVGHELTRTTEFLDSTFPLWRHNPYIKLSYAMAHTRAYKMLWVGYVAYRGGLIRPCLALYNWYLKTFSRELKW